MKQLTCEMCGGTDLMKQDGVFVCQSCGTKYSVEEAKKMIEGAVDVSGSTIMIDTSTELSNLYQIARRAKEENNSANAAKYYEMILIKDPSSWEANFYAAYFKSQSCTIAEISMAATNVNNSIESTFVLIRDTVVDAEERKAAITEVKNCAYSISDMLKNAAKNHLDNIDPMIQNSYITEFAIRSSAANQIKETLCDKMCEIFGNDRDVFSELGVDILKERINVLIFDHWESIDSDHRYVREITKYDPNYHVPVNQAMEEALKQLDEISKMSNSSSGGCYVATAVYGSYNCPQVWTLRRFRDYTLAETWYGRAFIRTYYAISPTLVKWFGHTEWFKKMWKGKLDHMVANLNAEGVEDTPYEDRNW